jgi:hypothetical protein
MKIKRAELGEEFREFLKPIFGKACCRQRVSEPRGLRLGFGEKIYHGNPKLIDAYYGDWELGTYYCAWRVIKGGRILCGSDDSVESANELNSAICQIDFGAIQSIEHLSSLDIRLGFDTGIMVDFLATTSDGTDECLGIVHNSSHRAAEFSVEDGWTIGASNLPWQK